MREEEEDARVHAGAQADGGEHAEAHPPHNVLQPELSFEHLRSQAAAGLEAAVQQQYRDQDEECEGVAGQPGRTPCGGRGGRSAKGRERAQRRAEQRQPGTPIVQLLPQLHGTLGQGGQCERTAAPV